MAVCDVLEMEEDLLVLLGFAPYAGWAHAEFGPAAAASEA
jgi:hypothetical protein